MKSRVGERCLRQIMWPAAKVTGTLHGGIKIQHQKLSDMFNFRAHVRSRENTCI